MVDAFLESFSYVLPALVTGAVAYYMFKEWIYNLKEEKKIEALVHKKKETLQIKLQAYERMLLFCDRIQLKNLTQRVKLITNHTESYTNLLIQTIEQEFEHNFVQQLYVSDESWTAITTAKNSIILKLKSFQNSSATFDEFLDKLNSYISQNESPTEIALQFIKADVKKLI